MWGSKPKSVTDGLPEERKALALRYTIDAVEAERREKRALEATAAQARSANGSNAAKPAVAPATPTAAAPATAPQRSYLPSTLKERVGKARNPQDYDAIDPRIRLRTSHSPHRSLRCARCGHECSDEARDWTLRLFGDDQLHAVCRDCDERDFSDARESGPLSLRPLAE